MGSDKSEEPECLVGDLPQLETRQRPAAASASMWAVAGSALSTAHNNQGRCSLGLGYASGGASHGSLSHSNIPQQSHVQPQQLKL
mmetsp:Transcript_93776/g.185982  ORF Transcript_93776/g.185982 Transcript_93776/m.185982 type:complete len:85 (+) Transcript_93776:226-480(+)